MRNKRWIICCLMLSLMISANAQTTMRVNYQIAVPNGELREFIDHTAYRGISFEYYYLINRNVHFGMEIGWNIFHKEYGRQTYETDYGAVNMEQWRFKRILPVTFNSMVDLYRSNYMTFAVKYGIGMYWIKDELWAGMSLISDNSVYFGMVPGFAITLGPGGSTGIHLAVEYPFVINGQMEAEGRSHAHYWNFKMGISIGNIRE